jgi:hypothetical protein
MTEQTQAQQVVLSLELTVEQINVVLNALGKMPTESGVFPLRQFIVTQAQEKVDAIVAQQAAAEPADEDALPEATPDSE